jgi:hypothetical protein
LVEQFEAYVSESDHFLSLMRTALERRCPLIDLQRLAQLADTRYARLQCPDRAQLMQRVQTTKYVQLNWK